MGDAYFTDNGAIYQAAGGNLRILAADPSAVNLGLDNADNLYVLGHTRTGQTGFGCASSTTISILRFTAKELAAANPAPTTVSEATYPGFVALWAGSSSFFRGTGAGDAYWVASQLACGGQRLVDEVFHAAENGQQSIAYQATPPAMDSPAAQGPLGMAAINPGTIYVTATGAGQLVRLGP